MPPVIKGGQGRSDESIRGTASILLWEIIAVVSLFVILCYCQR